LTELALPPPALGVIPHRKTIRTWLIPVSQRNTIHALALSLLDFTLFGAAVAATVAVSSLALKLVFGVLAGVVIARLFILGHDACHQSFTPHRGLNRWLGRLLFLPSLTPYSLWDTGHNVVHHGYTNLKNFDMVWAPLTLAEYRALPTWRRVLERTYRSGWAPWLYYFVEMWWQRMYFPSKRQMPTRRGVFIADGLLVTGAAAVWIGALVWASLATNQSVTTAILTGFVLPFLVWNAFIGFVVYVHHTHTAVKWYDKKADWSAAQPFVSTTVHLRFKPFLGIDMGRVLHNIMEHTAHHVDMTIPLYRLRRAQAILEAKLPDSITVQTFSWRWYFGTARACKLYDFERNCWTDFDGRALPAVN